MAALDLKRSLPSPQPVHLPLPLLSVAPLTAIQHIRKMRGLTQAHLMRGSDGHLWVVKFQTNPLHPRVLANEFLATRLGLWLGLSMPQVEVMEVSSWLIAHSPALHIEIGESRIPCGSGLQFASRYAADPACDQLFDHLPKSMFKRVANRQDLVRALAFDKWVGNCDSRQVLFIKRHGRGQGQFYATCIDQGYCFNGGRWSFPFPDLPLMGVYESDHIYRNVTGWNDFEPLLSRIENIPYSDLWRCAAEIPQEWYQYDGQALFRLIGAL